MSEDVSATPFDSLESSHQYVALLTQAIGEARRDVESEIALAIAEHADRRRDALQLVLYKLTKLETHMHSGQRILNDLRTLRRLLLDERGPKDATRHGNAER